MLVLSTVTPNDSRLCLPVTAGAGDDFRCARICTGESDKDVD